MLLMNEINESLSVPRYSPKISNGDAAKPAETTVTPAELAALEGMTKDALVNLIRRVGGAVWGIGMMTDDQAYDAVCLKLLHGGLTEKDIWKALPTLREWVDRKRGKSVQTIVQTNLNANVRAFDMTGEQLEGAIRKIAGAGQLPAGVRLLEGGMIEVDADYQDVTGD